MKTDEYVNELREARMAANSNDPYLILEALELINPNLFGALCTRYSSESNPIKYGPGAGVSYSPASYVSQVHYRHSLEV